MLPPRLPVVLLVSVIGMVGCTASSVASRPPGSTSSATTSGAAAEATVSCASVPLKLTWSGTALFARNEGAACRLDAQPLVRVPWWRGDDTLIKAPVGVLQKGQVLVQGYRVVSSNGCPPPDGRGPASLTVSVAGRTYQLPLAPERVHEIMVCESARASATAITVNA